MIELPDPTAPPRVVSARSLGGYEDTFVDLSKVIKYNCDIEFNPLSLYGLPGEVYPAIRDKRRPNGVFVVSCVLEAPGRRWFARGGWFPSRAWFDVHPVHNNLSELMRIRRKQAAEILIKAGFDLPPYLAAIVTAIAGGGEPLRTVEPKSEDAAGEERVWAPASPPLDADQTAAVPDTTSREGRKTDVTPIPSTEEALALELRRLGRPTRAHLVEFLIGKHSAHASDVAEHVHGNKETSDKTIGLNCNRTSEDAEALGSPYRYSLSAGMVFKTP